MFTPADRHHFADLIVFDQAVKGDVFEIDSGMGGSFTVVFMCKTENGYKFCQPAHNDFPSANLTYKPDEILHRVYICPPESSVFREWNTAVIELNGKQYAVDKGYGTVWVESPDGYFKLFRKKWKDADKEEAEAARRATGINRKRKNI